MLGGLAAGTLAGFVVGCVLSWGQVSGAYTGWHTCWQDCGPHLFVPVWIGAVVGLVSMLERDSLSGALITVFSGGLAGFFAATVFWHVFDKHFRMYFGSVSVPYIVNLVHAVCGGAAGFAWHLAVNRFFRRY
ncbi:MAG: hypothetical protein KJ760_19810 [Proteobacteria bacterium]|nr:hypothetical protein [Pseudomonadota bacterium]